MGAETSRLHADDGVEARVETGIAAEDFNADGELLEPLCAAGDCLFDDEVQEPLDAVGLTKRLAGDDAVQLLCHQIQIDARYRSCALFNHAELYANRRSDDSAPNHLATVSLL